MTPQIPHDVGAERAIIGAVLLRPSTLHDVAALDVCAESFYREPHRLLWRSLIEVDAKGPVDLVTVAGELEQRGKLDVIGGYAYLTELSASCPDSSHVERYAETVLEHARSRALLLALTSGKAAIESGEDFETVAGSIAQVVEDGSPKPKTAAIEGETSARVVARILEGRRGAQSLPTGIEELDELGRIVVVGKVTLIIGDTGMGKSALLDQICVSLARDAQPGCVFGLEMEREEYTERRIANLARVPYDLVQDGRLTDEQKTQVLGAHEVLDPLPLTTDDGMPTMRQILNRTRQGVRVQRWKWIAIDHAHIVPATDPGMREAETIAEVARYAMIIAKTCSVAVLIAVQMNADIKKRPEKRPFVSDVKYGGPLSQAASTIVGVYRDAFYKPSSEAKDVAELIVRKARFGRLGTALVRWRGEHQAFDSMWAGGEFE